MGSTPGKTRTGGSSSSLGVPRLTCSGPSLLSSFLDASTAMTMAIPAAMKMARRNNMVRFFFLASSSGVVFFPFGEDPSPPNRSRCTSCISRSVSPPPWEESLLAT